MELTLDLLKQQHKEFNKLYFDNSLSTPKIKIENKSKRTLGYYKHSNNSIVISNYYKRELHDYLRTLLHEMIHQYIHEKNIRDTSSHGYYFKHYAKMVNKDGWNITAKEKMPIDVKTNSTHLYYVIRFKQNDGRYFILSTASNCHNTYYKFLKEKYLNVVKYTTTNPIFSNFRQCRTKVVGRFIYEKDFALYL
jgi:antirestriction protein ArdC